MEQMFSSLNAIEANVNGFMSTKLCAIFIVIHTQQHYAQFFKLSRMQGVSLDSQNSTWHAC